MNILPIIGDSTEERPAIFRDLYAHPELGFTEERTSAIVADKLGEYGVDEVYTGLGNRRCGPARRYGRATNP